MSETEQPVTVANALTLLWGNTPPGRWLSRQSTLFLLASIIYIALKLGPRVVSGLDVAPPQSWRNLIDFTSDGCYALCLLWFGFQLWIGLLAKFDRTSPWGAPAALICAGISAALVDHSLRVHFGAARGAISPLIDYLLISIELGVIIGAIVLLIPVILARMVPKQAVQEEERRHRAGQRLSPKG